MTASTVLTRLSPFAPERVAVRPALRAASLDVFPTGLPPQRVHDLTCRWRVRLATAGAAVGLEHAGELRRVRIQGAAVLIAGRDFTLRLSLPVRHRLATPASSPGQRLCIEELPGAPIMEMTPVDTAAGVGMRILLGLFGAEQNASPCLPDGRHYPFSAGRGNVWHADWAGFGDPAPFDAVAEAGGWWRLAPARLRRLGRALAVDRSLLHPFLEALADQALPVGVLAGQRGLVHGFDGVFYGYRERRRWILLDGEDARLRLNPEQVAAAWVLRRDTATGQRHELRLYDASGLALLRLQGLPDAGGGENPIWRTLVKALDY